MTTQKKGVKMDFYQTNAALNGVFQGRVLVQAHGAVGGFRNVFVKLRGSAKNGLVFPPIGCIIKNPFKGYAKAYAGDLVEFRADGTGYILKSYEVAKATSAGTDTTIYVKRDGYRHVPFVGDILMLAGDNAATAGTGAKVTAVEKTTDSGADVWKVTLSSAIGTLAAGDVLVEGTAEGSSSKPVVSNPNAFLPCDYDFLYEPPTGDEDFDGARYFLTPCIANEDTKLYESKMSPIPPYVKKLNRSLVAGWFNL